MGYYRAGFEVVGVDINPQKHYPFEFIQADALALDMEFMQSFDAIHASPPCQAHTSLRTMWNAKRHVDLVDPSRQKLIESGLPYVIENVPGAPLHHAATLCGTMFGLGVKGEAELRRHRVFEASFLIQTLQCRHGKSGVIGVYGGHGRNRKRVPVIGVYGGGHGVSLHRREKGEKYFTAHQQREAMGIDWMTVGELSQAIPPAYTEFIGRQLIDYLKAVAA